MSEVLPNLLYSKEHEWILKLDGGRVRLGITDFAQAELGDIVFAESPEDGASFQAGDSIGTVESVKAVSDIYTPVSGKIVKINTRLESNPELINAEPYGEGWMVEMELSDPSELDGLLSPQQYGELTGAEE